MADKRDYTALPHEYLEEMAELDDAEFGRLVRALLCYSRDGEPVKFSGNERFYAVRVMAREDRYRKSYREQAQKRSRHAQAAAIARWDETEEGDGSDEENARACLSMEENARACLSMEENARACLSMKENARACSSINEHAQSAKTKTETKTEAEERESAHAHGAYGWVKLTKEQYEKLLRELGREETERCIAYVDESAQATGNRNQWRDWELTVRRCHRDGWGCGA